MNCPVCSVRLEEGATRCPACGADPRLTLTSPPIPGRGDPTPRLDFPPGARFAGRFTIVEKAGVGGMGVVYKAIDNSLDLVVALKLIRQDLARVPAFVERFKQEVRLTRQVTHPNVCRVHDLGESQDLLYLSMEWIEGETLRELLNKAGSLEAGRALEIAERIAEALAAAHSRGITHRDLKPENVMIGNDGSISVLDFGIAVGAGPSDTHATGRPVGTPAYMSPEQRRGERVDARTDLFALGLILLEMLSGRSPDPEHPDHSPLPASLRRPLAEVLESLLAAEKEARCPAAEAAALAIRGLQPKRRASLRGYPAEIFLGRHRRTSIWAGTMLLVGVAALALLSQQSSRSDRRPQSPGATSAGHPYYETARRYLVEDAETLRSLDDAIQMLHRAVSKDPDFALAWATLGEAYWIRYERTKEFSSREEAVRAVEKSFQLEPELAEAYNARGRGLTAEGKFKEARAALEKAVALKRTLDEAWANLGVACQELDDYQAGLRALQTAIRLKPDSFRHRISRGLFFYHFNEYDRAAAAYREALRLKPDSILALDNLGATLLYTNHAEEAVEAFRKSLSIEKNDHYALSNLGTAYYVLEKYEEAAEQYRLATRIAPGEADYWGNLGDALRMLERKQEAQEAYLQAVQTARERVELQPQNPQAHLQVALYCARARETACALAEGDLVARMQPDNVEAMFRNAVIRCILGRVSESLDWLEKAVTLGLSKVQIQNDPDLTLLHQEPRYRRILELAS